LNTESNFTYKILFDKLIHQFCLTEQLDVSMVFHIPYDRILKILQVFFSKLGADEKKYTGIGGLFNYVVFSANGDIIDSKFGF